MVGTGRSAERAAISRRRPLRLLGTMILTAALCAVFLFASRPASAQSPTPTPPLTLTRIDPVTQNVTAGTQVIARVMVDDVTNLGSYEFTLAFDPGALSLVRVQNGNFLGSSGRSVICLPARFETDANGNGIADGDDLDLDDDGVVPEGGLFRFGCVTLGETPPGPSGSGLLATVTLGTSCEGSSNLDFMSGAFDAVGLSDTAGRTMATRTQGASVSITGGAACPTPVPTETAGPVTPTNTPAPVTPSATPTPTVPPTPVPQQCGPAAGVAVCVVPPFQSFRLGDEVTVRFAEDNGLEVGAFQFTLVFNAAVLTPVDVSVAPFLGSTGRSVVCRPTIGTDRVELVCITLGTEPPGPDGSGFLADVRFQAASLGLSPLHLENVILVRVSGDEIPLAALQDGALGVVSGPTPTPSPSSTSTQTPTSTSTPTLGPPPTETPTATPCPPEGCPTPTETSTPSQTPTRTVTPTPSQTATPRATSTPTSTSTPGPTPVPPRCDSGSSLVVCLRPLFQRTSPGAQATVDVAVDNVSNLGAFQFTLVFNPSLVSVVDAEVGELLGSTSRPVNCLHPAPAPGTVELVCVTLGTEPLGPNGSGELARITLRGENLGFSPLALEDLILTDVSGIAFPPPLTQGAAIEVAVAPTPTPSLTPTTTLSPTPTLTPTAILSPTPSLTPTPCPTEGCPTATVTNTATETGTPTTTPTLTPVRSVTATPSRTSVPTITPTPGPLTVRVDPPLQRMPAGATASVDLVVDGVRNLGAFQLQLRFNGAVVAPQTVVSGPFLGSTTRSVVCQTPVFEANRIEFVCATLGSVPPGPDGSGVLATVQFRALVAGLTPLHFEEVILADVSGIELAPVAVQDGALLVDPALATPTATETATPTVTATPAAGSSLAPADFTGFARAALAAGSGEKLVLSVAGPEQGPLPVVGRQTSAATVFIDPAAADLFLGAGPLVLAERVEGIPLDNGLQAFQLEVSYDQRFLALDVQPHPFLASTGRSPYCLQARSEGRVRISCFSIGSQDGPSGDGILVGLIVRAAPELKLRAAEDNGIALTIDNIGAHTRLASKNPLALGPVSDGLVTARVLVGDTNGDCVVNVVDQQRMAGRYLLRRGSLLYDPLFDLEPAVGADGDIDIRDLQVAYGHVGNTCAGSLQFADQDGDGCRDADELGSNPIRGGQRNPLYPYDFYDTPPKDSIVSIVDVVALVNRFGGTAGPPPKKGYDPEFDRTFIGPKPWDLGPPDGVMSIGDIVYAVSQFGHTCSIVSFDLP